MMGARRPHDLYRSGEDRGIFYETYGEDWEWVALHFNRLRKPMCYRFIGLDV
jgi:hypothetical protein